MRRTPVLRQQLATDVALEMRLGADGCTAEHVAVVDVPEDVSAARMTAWVVNRAAVILRDVPEVVTRLEARLADASVRAIYAAQDKRARRVNLRIVRGIT